MASRSAADRAMTGPRRGFATGLVVLYAIALVLIPGAEAAAGSVYLMTPPMALSPRSGGLEPARERPLREWIVNEVFRSIDECEEAREAEVEHAGKDLEAAARLGGQAWGRALEIRAELATARCIASDNAGIE